MVSANLLNRASIFSTLIFRPKEHKCMPNPPDALTRRRLLGGLSVAVCTTLSGCTFFSDPQTETGQSARVVIGLQNPSETEQRYEMQVTWDGSDYSQFSGTLQPEGSGIEMIATTDTAPDSATFFIGIASSGESAQGTWNPTECRDYRVDAVIENGTPSFEATCRV